MNLPQSFFTAVHWPDEPVEEHPGETGTAYWRTRMFGNVRVRLVEYSPGYVADHWCERGHVLFVVEGQLTAELRDGRTHHLTPGSGYFVSDHGDSAHRSVTATGAKLFIVD
jgi:quercetin dioxygenase-like cupin family protein